MNFHLNAHLRGRVIGPQNRVGGEQCDQTIDISTVRGMKEGIDLRAIRLPLGGSWQVGTSNLLAGKAGEFAGGFGRSIEFRQSFWQLT